MQLIKPLALKRINKTYSNMYLTKPTILVNQPIKLNILKPNYQKIISFAKNTVIGIFSLLASIVMIKVMFVIINL